MGGAEEIGCWLPSCFVFVVWLPRYDVKKTKRAHHHPTSGRRARKAATCQRSDMFVRGERRTCHVLHAREGCLHFISSQYLIDTAKTRCIQGIIQGTTNRRSATANIGRLNIGPALPGIGLQ